MRERAVAERFGSRIPRWPSEAWLGIGWGALGLGNAINHGAYTTRAVLLMVLGVAAILVGALRWSRQGLQAGFGHIGVYVALGVAAVVALRYPVLDGHGHVLAASKLLTLGAVAVAAGGAFLRGRRAALFAFVVALPAISAILAIGATPDPHIDVWYMYQTATQSLLHGHNFYTAHWTSGMPGEVSNQFVYLPGSVLLLAPFKWLFGDVRFGLVAALVLAALGVFRMTSGRKAWLLAGLVMLLPQLAFGVQQSWNDPLLLALIVGTVYSVRRGRGWPAVVCFAIALACKQYAWLFLPAAAVWPEFGWRRAGLAAGGATSLCVPWILASPSAFWRGAFAYNLHLPARLDSLSLYSLYARQGLTPGYGLIAAGTLGAIGLSVWLARRGSSGFVLGAGIAMAGFNLVNKQSFFNEWSLVIGLVGLSMALVSSEDDVETVDIERLPRSEVLAID